VFCNRRVGLRDLLAHYACDWLQLEFSRHQPTLPICATTSNGWLPDSLTLRECTPAAPSITPVVGVAGTPSPA